MSMRSLVLKSMLFSGIVFTLSRVFWFLFLLNDDKSIINKFFHLLIIELGYFTFIFILSLIFICIVFLLIISGFIWSFISLIRSLWSILVSAFIKILFGSFTTNLGLRLGCRLLNCISLFFSLLSSWCRNNFLRLFLFGLLWSRFLLSRSNRFSNSFIWGLSHLFYYWFNWCLL